MFLALTYYAHLCHNLTVYLVLVNKKRTAVDNLPLNTLMCTDNILMCADNTLMSVDNTLMCANLLSLTNIQTSVWCNTALIAIHSFLINQLSLGII